MIIKKKLKAKKKLERKSKFPSPKTAIVAGFLYIITEIPNKHENKHTWLFPLKSDPKTIALKMPNCRLLNNLCSGIEKETMKVVFSYDTSQLMAMRIPDHMVNLSIEWSKKSSSGRVLLNFAHCQPQPKTPTRLGVLDCHCYRRRYCLNNKCDEFP